MPIIRSTRNLTVRTIDRSSTHINLDNEGERQMVTIHADRGRQGRSFVELIFVLVVIAAAGSYFIPQYFGLSSDSLRQNTNASVLTDARDASCRTNLNVIRQAVAAKKMDGAAPKSLSDAGVAGEARFPAGGEEYTYSPENSALRCPHPGHESF